MSSFTLVDVVDCVLAAKIFCCFFCILKSGSKTSAIIELLQFKEKL